MPVDRTAHIVRQVIRPQQDVESAMPMYEYECEKCHRTFEVEQKITEPKLTTCVLTLESVPCEGEVKRLISGPGSFVLKGGGWAKDGY